MSSLKLITTENFNNLPCNFYRNMNDDILLTREQIGQALEYSNPDVALSKIHKRHADRLDPLSVVTKMVSTDGKEYQTMLYTERGIMEICRWSHQRNANLFMDWVWDVIEAYRHNELQQPNIQSLIDAITALAANTIQIQRDIVSLKESIHKSKLPEKKYSRWKTKIFQKLNLLTQYVNDHSDQTLQLKDAIHITINEMEDTYGIDLPDYVAAYKSELSLDKEPYAIDVINHYKDIQEMYTLTVDSILDKLHIKEENDNMSRNIFDELAARIEN